MAFPVFPGSRRVSVSAFSELPIRGQFSGHVIHLDQSEASMYLGGVALEELVDPDEAPGHPVHHPEHLGVVEPGLCLSP